MTKKKAMEDLAKCNHLVSPSTAKTMLKKYKAFRKELSEWDGMPVLPIATTFNKKAIAGLVKLPGFYGLRISYGINAANELSLLLEGIDANGKVITATNLAKPGGTVDEGQMSPPYP